MPKVYRGVKVPTVITVARVRRMVAKFESLIQARHMYPIFTCLEFRDIVKPLIGERTPEVLHKRESARIGWQHLLCELGISASGSGFNDTKIRYSGQKWLFKVSTTPNGRRLALLKDLLAALEAQA